MLLNNKKKRKLACFCDQCKGYVVPENTARKHRDDQEYRDSLKEYDSATSDASAIVDESLLFSSLSVSAIDAEYLHTSDTIDELDWEISDLVYGYEEDACVLDDGDILNSEETDKEIAVTDENWTEQVLSMLNDTDHYGDTFVIKEANINTINSARLKGVTYLFLCLFLLIYQVEYVTFTATHKLLELFRVLFTDINFPKSLPTIRKETSFNSLTDGIKTYATCPKCFTVYLYSTNDGLVEPSPPRNCTYINFLDQRECLTALYKNESNVPIKRTVYHCLINSIQKLYLRKGFEEKCEEWRHLNQATSPDDIIYHCSQGKMWRSMLSSNGSTFVDDERALCLTLNADGFQPFDNTSGSCVAYYIQINNLPVDERIKKENTILLCIVEGPGESNCEQTQNILQLVTRQLRSLYFGVRMTTFNSSRVPNDCGVIVKACLIQVLADLPMQRKLSSFTGFSSTRSCFRCDRSFIVFPDSKRLDYSGFEDYHYIPNNNKALNDLQADKWYKCKSKVERKRQERMHGMRFSTLRSLRYLDLVKSTSQDYLHCIWLGMAKSIMSKYEDSGFFSDLHYKSMAVLASTIILPHGYQSINHKIKGGFSFMKGHEYEIWVLHYSEYVLKYMVVNEKIPVGFKKDHYQNWIQFVQACKIIVQPSISLTKAAESRELLRSFCKGYAILFGPESIKPNFHYSLHLYDNIEQFGSSFNTSCFSLERMNGFLKNSTENRNITSIQHTYMANFLESIHSSSLIKRIGNSFLSKDQLRILEDTSFSTPSYTPVNYQARINFYELSSYDFTSADGIVTGSEKLYKNHQDKSTNFEELKSTKMKIDHLRLLIEYYSICYPQYSFTSTFHLSNSYPSSANNTSVLPLLVSGDIKISKTFRSDVVYSSRQAKSMKGAYIQAFFKGPLLNDSVASYYGEIQYFFQHILTIEQSPVAHTFAFVKWFKSCSSNISGPGEKTMELCKGYEDLNAHCILPVHRIYSVVTVACTKDNSTNPRIPTGCIVVIPQEKKLFV